MINLWPHQKENLKNIRNTLLPLAKNKPNAYTSNQLKASGFDDTKNDDIAVCKHCKLKISNKVTDNILFQVHLKQKPNCPFVQSVLKRTSSRLDFGQSNSLTPVLDINSLKKSKKDQTTNSKVSDNILFETNSLQRIRNRTFSHWSQSNVPSAAQMIEAGFFYCNIRDRVICIYCNLICQQWNSKTDDPYEVHKNISPNCIYVKAELVYPRSLLVFNNDGADQSSKGQPFYTNNIDLVSSMHFTPTVTIHSSYSELPKRHASFSTWPNENLPSVDDLARAGFFYTGTQTRVTCFYCNGSLQNWGANDNPTIEHARWFPHCAYTRQLCGDELYHKIQKAKQNLQKDKIRNNATVTNNQQLLIPDEDILFRLVEERLGLSISQRLLNKGFKLPVIERCWEVQLRLKKADFVSYSDLYIACLILQKQFEYIDGIEDKIVVPSLRMQQIRPQNVQTIEQLQTQLQSIRQRLHRLLTDNHRNENKSNDTLPSNPCVLCLTKEKKLACLPCGHLATCEPCGRSLRSCPICRREVEAFVRVYN